MLQRSRRWTSSRTYWYASRLISGMIKSSCRTVRELAETAIDFVNERGNRRCWIDLVCTSGRHRSVGMSV